MQVFHFIRLFTSLEIKLFSYFPGSRSKHCVRPRSPDLSGHWSHFLPYVPAGKGLHWRRIKSVKFAQILHNYFFCFSFCIQNLLNNFSRSDTLTVIARVFLLFQMMTVFPLLAYILRTQLLYAFFHSAYPSFRHVFGLNVSLLIICVVFAIFLPQVGTITRYIYNRSHIFQHKML